MDKNKLRSLRQSRRKAGIRKRVFGTPERPRLSIFRSNLQIYAQIVNDVEGKTIASASSLGLEKGGNIEAAAEVGKKLAENAKAAGIGEVAFDRNGFRFHGRVKALADAAREGGLNF